MEVFPKNWFFGGVDQIKVQPDRITIQQWGKEKSYFWNQILLTELREYTVVMSSSSIPLKRRVLYLKTERKKYQIRLSNRYSSEIKNPDRFLQALGKYLTITRITKRDFSQLKVMIVWMVSIFFVFLLQHYLHR